MQGYDEIIMTAIDYEKTDRSFIEALGLKDPTDGYYIVSRYPKGMTKYYYEYSINTDVRLYFTKLNKIKFSWFNLNIKFK